MLCAVCAVSSLAFFDSLIFIFAPKNICKCEDLRGAEAEGPKGPRPRRDPVRSAYPLKPPPLYPQSNVRASPRRPRCGQNKRNASMRNETVKRDTAGTLPLTPSPMLAVPPYPRSNVAIVFDRFQVSKRSSTLDRG